MTTENDNSEAPTLEELYPQLSDEELEEAEENLRRYVAAVYRVHCRLYGDEDARDELETLTEQRRNDEIEG